MKLAVVVAVELAILAYVYPPPLGWRAELHSVFANPTGFHRPNLSDPAVRLAVTEGRQSIDAQGQVIECAEHRAEPACKAQP